METQSKNPETVEFVVPQAPDSVTDAESRELYRDVNVGRRIIKGHAAYLDALRRQAARLMKREDVETSPEVIANITLAYRHLEDASMRLGKALQAIDGGVSVYDRATTVGA
jgi:hypothetical protein